MIEKSGKRYLTVREFASRAGRSNQAIYKKLDNQLSTFVIVVDNQKFLDEMALEEVFNIEVDNQVDNQVNQVDNQSSNLSQEPENQDHSQTDLTKDLLEMLKEEIKKKDQQIEVLQERLDKAYMQISEMAQKAQYITAADKTEKIMQQQSKEESEVIDHMAAAAAENKESRSNETAENKEEGEHKGIKGFFKRLFS